MTEIAVTDHGRVVEVAMRRPHRRNALAPSFAARLAEAFTGIDAGCVLLTAEGPSFCAGYDLHEVDLDENGRRAARADHIVPIESAVMAAIEACPVPVVAAIQGAAYGGGFELALACDVRVAADDAVFGLPAGRLGLVYSHTGAAAVLRALGPGRARRLLLLGDSIDAATALEWGLVERVVARADLHEEARRLADVVADQAPLAQRGNRRVLQLLEAAGGALEGQARDEAERLREESLASADFAGGILAFRERRAPRWSGR